jgi:hypothetical protein
MVRITETREAILKQIRDSEESAARLIAGVSELQGNWQPVTGRSWSIWQCLEHLSLTAEIYSKALADAVASTGNSGKTESTGTEIKPGWFARWFLSQLEPPVRLRLNTIAKVTPAATGNLAVALADFIKSHEAVREILKSWDRMDFNRVCYPSPFASSLRFTVGTGLLILNAHDRRHLWQAERVKQAPAYPKA